MPHERKGSKFLQIRVQGVRQSSGTTDWERATYLENKLNAEAWDRENRGIERAISWDEACLNYLKERQHLKNVVWKKTLATWWKQHLSGKPISEIDRTLVDSIISNNRPVTEQPSPQNNTANCYAYFVSLVLKCSGRQVNVRYYPAYKAPDRYLSIDEWRALESVMPEDLRQIATFSLATGLRQGNVMGLQWDCVKSDTLVIPARFTKTSQDYGIPLNKTAQRILKDRSQGAIRGLGQVFLLQGRTPVTYRLDRAWWRAIKAAGIPHMKWHGLRHTFASWLAEREVPWDVIARLGCWKPPGTVNHYVHLSVGHLRKWTEVLDAVLSQPVQETEVTQEKTA